MGYYLKYSNLTHKVCALFILFYLFTYWQRNSHIVESVPKVFLSLFYFILIFLECIFILFFLFLRSLRRVVLWEDFKCFVLNIIFKSISICLSIFFSTKFREKLLFILFNYFFKYFFLTDFFFFISFKYYFFQYFLILR